MRPSCLKPNHRAVTKDQRPSSPEREQKVTGRSPPREVASNSEVGLALHTGVDAPWMPVCPAALPRSLAHLVDVQQALCLALDIDVSVQTLE